MLVDYAKHFEKPIHIQFKLGIHVQYNDRINYALCKYTAKVTV